MMKKVEREANRILPSSAEINNAWSYSFSLSLSSYVLLTWRLIKHTDKFTFFSFSILSVVLKTRHVKRQIFLLRVQIVHLRQ